MPDFMAQADFIIFGAGNYNSLGVLHAMAEAGISVFILCVGKARDWEKGNIIGYSRFAGNIHVVDTADEGAEWLLSHMEEFPQNTIVYPTGDNEEKALDMRLDALMSRFRFPNAGKQGAVARLMDKHIQADLAEKAGIRILKSQFTNSDDFSFAKVNYPCMVKPLDSTSGSKGDMRVCRNEDELKKALVSARHTKDFIVQQYIVNEADLLFLGISFPDGSVEIPALVRKPGVSPTGEYTHALVTTDVEAWLPEKKEVETFVRSLGYTGPFSIEFGLEKGKNYFFEINLRNDGTSHYPLNARVNIPFLYYTSIRSNNIPTVTSKQEYEMIDEVGDVRRVLNREIGFGKWFKNFKSAGTYRFYNANDKRLLPYICLMFTRRILCKIYKSFSSNS